MPSGRAVAWLMVNLSGNFRCAGWPRSEGDGVLRVAIMQEIVTVLKGAASLHGHVPGHLLHPSLVRVNGDPGHVHLAALEVNEKQHVVDHQSAQREDLHREKVGPRQYRQVSPNECRPGGRMLALRRGR